MEASRIFMDEISKIAGRREAVAGGAAEIPKLKIDFTTGEMRGPGGNLIGRVPTQDQMGDVIMRLIKERAAEKQR